MKKITSLLAMLVAIVATAFAQTHPQATISIGASTGTFYNGNSQLSVTSANQYLNKWVSSTTPALTLSCRNANIIINNDYPTDTKFNLHTDPDNYTLSYPEGKILSYTIKAYVTNAGSINGTAVSTDASNPTEITVTDINATTATIVIAGTQNPWMYITEFTVTVENPTPEQATAKEKMNSWMGIMALITDGETNYISNAQQSNEGSRGALLDQDNATYFHSAWGGNLASISGHDLQARLPEAVDKFRLYYVTRNTGTGYPTAFRIDGSNNAGDFTSAGGTGWTESVASLSSLPSGASVAYWSDAITMSDAYQYLRFVPTIGNNNNENWFCLAEFWILKSSEETDAAIEFLQSATGQKGAYGLTDEEIAQINQIDQDLRSTTVTVTYELYDNGTKVNSVEVVQAKNSAVSVPTDLTSGYHELGYDFTTSGEIGSTDCTIEVTATLKEGVVTDLANLSNDKVYTLTTRRGAVGTNGTILKGKVEAKNFNLVKYGEDYYLWSESDSKFVKNNGDLTENVADVAENGKLVVTTNGVRNGVKPFFFMGIGSNGMNVNDSENNIVVNTWTTRDDGNEYVIKENGDASGAAYTALDVYFNPSYTITYIVKGEDGATLFTSEPVGTTAGTTITTLPADYQHPGFYTYNEVNVTISESGNTNVEFTATWRDDAPVKFSTSVDNPIYYNLKIRDKYFVRAADNSVPNQDASEPFNPAASWALIGNPYNCRVINQEAGPNYFLMYDEIRIARHGVECTTLRENDTRTWVVDTNNNGGFVLHASENPSVYLHQRTSNGLSTCSVTEWGSVHDDDGSTIIASTDEDVLVQLYNLLKEMPIGTGPNQYSTDNNDAEAILAQVGADIDNSNTSNYADDYATLKALQEALTLNTPKAGFYRIKGKTSGKYLANGQIESGNHNFTMSDATDKSTIFWFDGTKLVNYETGMANGVTASTWAWVYGDGAVSTITFQDGLTNGGYGIQTSNANFYDSGDTSASADRGGNVTINANTNVRYRDWYLEEVTELPITLTEVDGLYYATFSAPVDIVEITGATLHQITVEGDYAKYKDVNVTGLLANTGVLLIGENEEATAYVGTCTEAVETGLSAQIASVVENDGLFFGIGSESGKLGFYPLAENMASGGFKAFIANNEGEAKELILVADGDVTGIDNLQLTIDNSAIYDLQGRKIVNGTSVNGKLPKGVFIQNGKKVVVK